MKPEPKKDTRFGRYSRAVAAGGLAILIFGLAHFAGYQINAASSSGSAVAENPARESRSVSMLPWNPDGNSNKENRSTANRPAPEKIEHMRVEDLPPAFLKSFREAEAFANRLPELEQELLEQHPLLQKANEIRERFAEKDRAEYDSEENHRIHRLWEKWNQVDGNLYKSTMRGVMQELDAYLEVMEDPQYVPFIEDGLRGGLSQDMAYYFYERFLNGAGFSMDGVELVPEGITDLGEFRQEFQRMADQIKSVPENRFAVEPLPGEHETERWEATLHVRRKGVLNYYQMSILPETLVTEQQQHLERLKRIQFQTGNFGPAEIWKVEDQLKANETIKPWWKF